MIEIKSKLKRWGRSFGVIVPMEKIKEEGISEKDTIEIVITKESNPVKETFGTFKFRKPIDKILKEVDREGWDE